MLRILTCGDIIVYQTNVLKWCIFSFLFHFAVLIVLTVVQRLCGIALLLFLFLFFNFIFVSSSVNVINDHYQNIIKFKVVLILIVTANNEYSPKSWKFKLSFS